MMFRLYNFVSICSRAFYEVSSNSHCFVRSNAGGYMLKLTPSLRKEVRSNIQTIASNEIVSFDGRHPIVFMPCKASMNWRSEGTPGKTRDTVAEFDGDTAAGCSSTLSMMLLKEWTAFQSMCQNGKYHNVSAISLPMVDFQDFARYVQRCFGDDLVEVYDSYHGLVLDSNARLYKHDESLPSYVMSTMKDLSCLSPCSM